MHARTPLLAALWALALAACGGSDEGALDIGYIDSEGSLFAQGSRLSDGAQHLRAATGAGLVALDQRGEVVPALADRWNVTDDGRSFVFRLRDGTWPDGSPLTADSVRRLLNTALRQLDGTSLGLDLAPIDEVRAMTGRVIEIRLTSPVPELLQLLAQPELVLQRGDQGAGPMELVRAGRGAVLTMRPPQARGLPEQEDWREHVRTLRLFAVAADDAMSRFDNGQLEVVLGGRLGALPLADTGPLSRGTVQIDPALGLFGLQVRRARGMLADDTMREALAMSLDRNALLAQLNIGGWAPTSRLVQPGMAGDPGLVLPRWGDQTVEELRARAAARVAQWRPQARPGDGEGAPGDHRTLSVALGEGPGFDMLFRELARQWATIGLTLVKANSAREADLVLVDRVARYASPRWFLNQFNCSLKRGLCSEQADLLVQAAVEEPDPQARDRLLASAEAELTLANIYIPFGMPLRWSMIRGNVDGFTVNSWAFHPLPEMAVIPR